MARSTWFLVIGLALISPWLVGRLKFLVLLYHNSPSRLPSVKAFSTYQILYEDTVRNCEDAVLDEEGGMALLSCDPGRDQWNPVMGTFISPHTQGEIWIYLYSQKDSPTGALLRPLGRHGFPLRNYHPLGIEYHSPTDTVFSVNVGIDGPGIEIFKLTPTRDNLIWQRTFKHPSLSAPNSMAIINEHELFVTVDHFFRAETFKPLSQLETYLAPPFGSVVYVNLKTNEAKTVANMPFPNGVKLLNSTHVAVASTNTPGVRIFRINPDTKELNMVQWFRTPFAADNLSLDSKGKLLIAGHPYPPEVEIVTSTNHQYNLDGKDDRLRPASERPRASTWVAEWDGNENGTLRDIYVGYEYGTACTAVRDNKRGIGIVTGLHEKGILVWKE